MVRKILPALLLSICYLQASGFSPSGPICTRLDIGTSSIESLPSAPTTLDQNLRDLPPVIQQIVDERREFQLNLGKAMDTLKSDMPDILKRSPGR